MSHRMPVEIEAQLRAVRKQGKRTTAERDECLFLIEEMELAIEQAITRIQQLEQRNELRSTLLSKCTTSRRGLMNRLAEAKQKIADLERDVLRLMKGVELGADTMPSEKTKPRALAVEAMKLADEAEKLANAASEGPWTAHHMNALTSGWIVTCFHKFGRAWKVNEQDAAFIADARTRVPALCAALRELADENERLRLENSGLRILLNENNQSEPVPTTSSRIR